VIEDAAHAFGSTQNGRSAGTFGDVGCFSFDPIKNITCGGGGIVVTNDDRTASRLASMSQHRRRHGFLEPAGHRSALALLGGESGFRYRMSNLNAAIGLEQLKKMPDFRARKKAIVSGTNRHFKGWPA